MKNTILALTALVAQTAMGNGPFIKEGATLVDYASCQEALVDHGFAAKILVDPSTNRISEVILSRVTIEDSFLVAELKDCQRMPADLLITHCEENVEDGYSIDILEGGVNPVIEAVLIEPKADRRIRMVCQYN